MKQACLQLLIFTQCFLITRSQSELFYAVEQPVYTEHLAVLQTPRYYKLSADVHSDILDHQYKNLEIMLPVNGVQRKAVLETSQIFADDFSIKTSSGEVYYMPGGLHYRGSLADEPGSLVAISLFEGEVIGVVADNSGNHNIGVVPSEYGQADPVYVSFNDRDVSGFPEFHCGVPDGAFQQPNDPPASPEAGAHGCKVLNVYIEADYRLYTQRNHNVTNVQNFVTGFFNVVSAIYQMEELNIQISEIFVWTSQDPYDNTTSGTGLTDFGTNRQDNFNGDIAHYITTVSNNNGGLAWLDVLCSSYDAFSSYGRFAYSNISNSYQNLPTFSWTVMVFSHEMGHNVGSPHTHSCSWELSPGFYGPIDTCYTPEGGCYNGPEHHILGTVMSYCHLSQPGINLNLGFGPLPGDLLRYQVGVNHAACLQDFGNQPSLSIISNTPVCEGQTLVLNSMNALSSYQWNGPLGFTTTADTAKVQAISLNEAGYYSLVYIDGFCSVMDSVFIDVYQLPPSPSIVANGGTFSVPSGAYFYQWYNQNGAIPGATGNSYAPQINGMYYVTVTSQVGNCTAYSDTLDFYLSAEEWEIGNVSIYPNPAAGQASIRMYVPYPQDIDLQLCDASGRRVGQKQLFSQAGTVNLSWDTSELAEGVYTIQVRSPNYIKTYKLLIQH